MSLTRRIVVSTASLSLVAGALVSGGGVGCALKDTAPSVSAPKAPEPLADTITPYRNFAAVDAVYENTGVAAWHTQYPLQPKASTPEFQRPVVEPVLFLANTLILPVTALVTEPLNEQKVHRLPAVAPGSTAAVPLDEVVDASDYGAYRPNLKPGLSSDLYGHAPATLPSQYGKSQWMRPLPAAQPEEVKAPATQPVLLP